MIPPLCLINLILENPKPSSSCTFMLKIISNPNYKLEWDSKSLNLMQLREMCAEEKMCASRGFPCGFPLVEHHRTTSHGNLRPFS